MTDFTRALDAELAQLREMLLAKNAAYGDSATNPLRVFSRADATEQLRVRIDDKLSRLARGNDAGEDTVADLIGYLLLLRIAERGETVGDNDRPEWRPGGPGGDICSARANDSQGRWVRDCAKHRPLVECERDAARLFGEGNE